MDALTFLRIISLTLALVALFVLVCEQVYITLKQQAEERVEEQVKKAIEEASRPVVKVEISTKGDW